MLTVPKLKEMNPGTVFAKGRTEGFKWIARRGGIHDWAIYIGNTGRSFDYIGIYGTKEREESNIKCLVPCDDEAFKMYRK